MVKNVQYNKKQAKMLRDNLEKNKPVKAKSEENKEDEESQTESEPEWIKVHYFELQIVPRKHL